VTGRPRGARDEDGTPPAAGSEDQPVPAPPVGTLFSSESNSCICDIVGVGRRFFRGQQSATARPQACPLRGAPAPLTSRAPSTGTGRERIPVCWAMRNSVPELGLVFRGRTVSWNRSNAPASDLQHAPRRHSS
jgi:hypothetical protein